MRDAELMDGARADLRGLLDEVGPEIAAGLRAVIAAGRISGWTYGSVPGVPMCVLGTAAYLVDGSCGPTQRTMGWARAYGTLETFVDPINAGDQPSDGDAEGGEGSWRAAMLACWIDEWMAEASDVRG